MEVNPEFKDLFEFESKEAEQLLQEYLNLGLPLEMAKKCAIKSLRRTIKELQFVDGVYMVGLKEWMDTHRKIILILIEK